VLFEGQDFEATVINSAGQASRHPEVSVSARQELDRKMVSSGSPYEGSIGFSRAVRMGSFIAVGGTAPILAESTEQIEQWSVYEQAHLCLQIVAKAVGDAGGALENVVRTRIMLTDMSQWREAARARSCCYRIH